MRLIDADALYEKACCLEAQAIDYTVKISNDKEKREEWLRWSAILAERSAFRHDVYDAPTIEPEPHWIPCSERLPEESGLYIVTNVGRWVEPVGTRYYNIRADGGFWSGHPGDKVLAWMELPPVYKEGADD